ncbi:hypothetical protein EJL05_20080 [Xanthomonas arboricola pv. pruni]|nr:hypothetical protein EJL05_20080 [Xanthomonas arboricola pv. pruni]
MIGIGNREWRIGKAALPHTDAVRHVGSSSSGGATLFPIPDSRFPIPQSRLPLNCSPCRPPPSVPPPSTTSTP